MFYECYSPVVRIYSILYHREDEVGVSEVVSIKELHMCLIKGESAVVGVRSRRDWHMYMNP